jgi:hypothetical protein
MEQRTLRLGDIVDDYCPRERRLTNHAIVAMVEDVIRQTRCTTCDAEHVYKGGQAPKRRLVKPGAAPSSGTGPDEPAAAPSQLARGPDGPASGETRQAGDVGAPPDDNGAVDANDPSSTPDPDREPTDLWVGHRPLIRATLPRQEGEQAPPARPIPEFTMHRYSRGADQPFRHHHGQPRGDQQPWSNGNGHPRGNGPFREGRGPGAPGGGHGRPGRRRRRRGGGKKSH